MEILVLGTGCPKCQRLEQLAHEAVEQAGVEAEVVHETDMDTILDYGVVSTPGLVVDGKLRCSGRLPRVEEIVAWIQKAD